MPADSRQFRAFALLALVMVLWAGDSIVGRAVRFDVEPMTLAFVRWAGASLILLPFAWHPLRRDWPAIVRAWKPILLLGLLGVGAFNALLYSGLRYTTATNALRLHCGFGDVLVLIAVVVWSLYTVLLRLRPAVSPTSFVAVTFLIGALAMAPFFAHDLLGGEHVAFTAKVLGAFAYVAVLPSIVAYFIFNAATETVGPARAGLAITLMPIFGAFLSAALLGEKLHAYHFAGMGLILLGIPLSLAGKREQPGSGAHGAAPLEEPL